MLNYSAMASMAARLLDENGQTITFTRTDGETFDPVLGQDSGGSLTTITGKGVALNYMDSEIDGTVVQTGDVRLIFESTATLPNIDDECTVNSIVYRVVNIEPLSPNGTLVINKIQLRK